MTKKTKLKWGNIIIAAIIIIALVLVVYFIFFHKTNTPSPSILIDNYDKYSFVRVNGTWSFDYNTNTNVYSIPIHYIPNELDNIPSGGITANDFANKQLFYITIDTGLTSKSVLSGVEIAKVFGQGGVLKKTVKSGLTYTAGSVPVITCQNVTDNTGVILMTLGNYSGISRADNGCIILSVQNEDYMMNLADRLVYIALGVMKS